MEIVFTLLLFLGMLLMLETGRRLGIARRRRESDSDRSNLGTIETALFAVFGLLMALTFTGATSRFNDKGGLIAQESTPHRLHICDWSCCPGSRSSRFRTRSDSTSTRGWSLIARCRMPRQLGRKWRERRSSRNRSGQMQ